jgi:Ca2+-binding RTX toxin-like protein
VQSFVVGDLNGDGFPDIAGSRPATGDVAIITNDASGLQPATFVDPDGAGGNNGRVAIADLDGDAVLDLAVPYVSGTQADKIAILIGRGDATFESSSFAPVGSGPRQVAVADLNRDGNQDLVSANSGAGNVSVLLATPPSVTVTGSIDFGAQAPGTSSAQQLITVRNDGPQRLRPASVTLGGSDAAAFTLSADGCTGANLPVGGLCTVGVGFTPTTVGPRSATVAIATNGAGTPHVVQLTGSGAEPTVPPGGGLLPGACANEKSGTAAADVLTGTELGDNLIGLDGNDKLNGLAGDDCLAGGDDNDKLVGGDGADKLNGGKGNDRLKGNAGKNKYKGGSGDDKIKAANGVVEKVNCGRGDDRATVDRKDKARHCEKVTRKRP